MYTYEKDEVSTTFKIVKKRITKGYPIKISKTQQKSKCHYENTVKYNFTPNRQAINTKSGNNERCARCGEIRTPKPFWRGIW